MPTLETYKKQAKQLLRWHRDGNHSVGGRTRQLKRYRQLTDREALALDFKLAEAQEIIAVEAGCESWAVLKSRVADSVPQASEEPSSVVLESARPVLFVRDVQVAAEYYRDLLGFTIDFLHGHPPFYGSISRDGATLHLRFVQTRPARVPIVSASTAGMPKKSASYEWAQRSDSGLNRTEEQTNGR